MFALSFRDNKDNIGHVRDWINMIGSENLDLKKILECISTTNINLKLITI